ncbi:MAG: histidine phosphatase family protein [Candidatus Woesearchaeota archaeon]
MRIYLVRHGETDWNLEMRIQGKTDVPLNTLGITQAEECAMFFRENRFDYVYSSGLKRAITTAQIISNGKMPIRTYAELNERNFGEWETRLWSEVRRNNPCLKEEWKIMGNKYQPPEGESILDMTNRVIIKFKEIIGSHCDHDSILIVSHGGPIKVMVGHASGLDEYVSYNTLKMDNCSINIIDYHDNLFNVERTNYVYKQFINC